MEKGIEFVFDPGDPPGALLSVERGADLPQVFTGVDQIQDQRLETVV